MLKAKLNKKKNTKHKVSSKRNIIIEADGIVKKYDTAVNQIIALNGIDLVVREGEFIAFLGPKGSGKTTLLNCLSGLEDIDKGEIYFKEVKFDTFSESEKRNLRLREMSTIYPDLSLIPLITVKENILLSQLIKINKVNKEVNNFNSVLEFLEIDENISNENIDSLNSLDTQKVALAKALVNEPNIIFIDEIWNTLNKENSEIILSLILRISREKNIAVIICTDDVNIAMKADRVLRMSYGKIIA